MNGSDAIAALVLVGATTTAILGTIDGAGLLTVYGTVLGYVFGRKASDGRPARPDTEDPRQ